MYDDRYPMYKGGISYDIGTQTLINLIPYTNFAKVSMHDGTWVHAQLNLLPYAKTSLDSAWAKGFLTESKNYTDYKIGGMNMGWELPGMNVSTAGVKGISLFQYHTATNVINKTVKITNNTLNIYPNPANNNITISSKLEVESYKVINIVGIETNIVTQHIVSSKNETIDISYLPKGIYIIEANTKQGIIRNKFIKQ